MEPDKSSTPNDAAQPDPALPTTKREREVARAAYARALRENTPMYPAVTGDVAKRKYPAPTTTRHRRVTISGLEYFVGYSGQLRVLSAMPGDVAIRSALNDTPFVSAVSQMSVEEIIAFVGLIKRPTETVPADD